jgi:predicted Zn-dependent peptidase
MKIINSCILGEKYYEINHFSGLDIYVIPKKLTTTYALIGTKFGSLDVKFKREDEDTVTCLPYGTAHYLEHKLFENSDGEDTFEKFAKYGAAANAYTSFSETRYLFSCSQNFEKCLEILLEFVTNLFIIIFQLF